MNYACGGEQKKGACVQLQAGLPGCNQYGMYFIKHCSLAQKHVLNRKYLTQSHTSVVDSIRSIRAWQFWLHRLAGPGLLPPCGASCGCFLGCCRWQLSPGGVRPVLSPAAAATQGTLSRRQQKVRWTSSRHFVCMRQADVSGTSFQEVLWTRQQDHARLESIS